MTDTPPIDLEERALVSRFLAERSDAAFAAKSQLSPARRAMREALLGGETPHSPVRTQQKESTS